MESNEVTTRRRNAIIEIIEEQSPIYSQSVIVEQLRKEYDIKAEQSTVSRDLTILKIVKAKSSGEYTLSKAEEFKKNKDALYNILNQADTIFSANGLYIPYLFKCNPSYSDAVCTQLELTLNPSEDELDDIREVFAVKGPTGSICLFIPAEREKEIKNLLNSFVN